MNQMRCTINPVNMLKKDLIIFCTHRCKHGVTYFSHPQCFAREYGRLPKIGYLDIETTGFDANYHHILTYVIKTRSKKEYKTGVITQKELLAFDFDKRLCVDLVRDMMNYDIVVTYFGTKFDIPFIRSRCLYWMLPFPKSGELFHKDAFYMVRRLLKLHSNRLEVATKFLGISGKNHVEGDIWMKARLGDKAALRYVLRHNKLDCSTLEKLHKRLEAYDKGNARTV